MFVEHIVDDAGLAQRSDDYRMRIDAARATLAASHHGYLRPSIARKAYAEAATALAAGDPQAALAKAEWGLQAMPADTDLNALAMHCRRELHTQRQDTIELQDAVRFLDEQRQNEESK